MRSIKREKELQSIITTLQKHGEALGRNTASGAVTLPLHMSVVAPAGGGLSLFLQDVAEGLGAKSGFRPVLITFDTADDWEDVVVNGLQSATPDLGGVALDRVSIQDLFTLARKSFEEGALLVLILDAGRAIASIEGDERWRGREDGNPFLQWLRGLVNLMKDLAPPLAIVVGWRDDFLETSSAWKANDVVQRYFPALPLYSDFEADDAWPIFEEILKLRGITVEDGPFPGFPRSRIPVGRLVASARNGRLDDGALLRVLRDATSGFGTEADGIPEELLVRLCLRDESVSVSDPGMASGPLRERLRSVTNPVDDRLVANDLLYAAVGISPPQFRVSLVKRLEGRFQERDPRLAVDVARQLGRAFSPSEENRVAEFESYAEVRALPLAPRPRGSSKMAVDIFCCFQAQLPKELLAALRERVDDIARRPVAWTAHTVLVLVADAPVEDHVRRTVVEYVKNCEPELAIEVGNGYRARFCATAVLSQEAVIELMIRGDAPTVQEALSDHFKAVQREVPVLGADDIAQFGATGLVACPFDRVRQSELKVEGNKAEIARRLVSAGILKKEGGFLYWDPTEDEFLGALGESLAAGDCYESVCRKFWIAIEHWSSLLSAAADAYTNDYIAIRDGKPLSIHIPEALVRRLKTAAEEAIQALSDVPSYLRAPFQSRIDEVRSVAQGSHPDLQACIRCTKDLVGLRGEVVTVKEKAEVERAGEVAKVSKLVEQAQGLPCADAVLERRRRDAVETATEAVADPNRAAELQASSRVLATLVEDLTRDADRVRRNLQIAVALERRLITELERLQALSGGAQSIAEVAGQLSVEAQAVLDSLAQITCDNSSTTRQTQALLDLQATCGRLEARTASIEQRAKRVTGGARTLTAPQPTVPQPTVPQPTVAQPTVAQPTVAQPTVAQPTVAQPTVPQPTVPEPTVPQPPVPQPPVPQPPVPQPPVAQPPVAQPPVPQPPVAQPPVPQPPVAQPPVPQSTVAQPTVPQSTVAQPTVAQPFTPTVLLTREFARSDAGIRELVEFLSSDPRIKEFRIE